MGSGSKFFNIFLTFPGTSISSSVGSIVTLCLGAPNRFNHIGVDVLKNFIVRF